MTTKREAIEMIARLPDDVALDDIIYALYFRWKVDRGLRDIEEGRTVSQEEVVRSLAARSDASIDGDAGP